MRDRGREEGGRKAWSTRQERERAALLELLQMECGQVFLVGLLRRLHFGAPPCEGNRESQEQAISLLREIRDAAPAALRIIIERYFMEEWS